MKVASAYPDRAPENAGSSGSKAPNWLKGAGVLAGVAVGAGILFAAQASSYEITAPQVGMTTVTTPMDGQWADSRGSRPAQAASRTATGDGPNPSQAGGHATPAASESLAASLKDGLITLADAAQPRPADIPAEDDSMMIAASGVHSGDDASTSAESFANGGSGDGSGAGGPGFAGAGGGGGAPQAASGVPGAQSAAGDGDGLNGLQPLQDAAASVAGVPEPATWTTMILGFGLIGATLRHRRKSLGLD